MCSPRRREWSRSRCRRRRKGRKRRLQRSRRKWRKWRKRRRGCSCSELCRPDTVCRSGSSTRTGTSCRSKSSGKAIARPGSTSSLAGLGYAFPLRVAASASCSRRCCCVRNAGSRRCKGISERRFSARRQRPGYWRWRSSWRRRRCSSRSKASERIRAGCTEGRCWRRSCCSRHSLRRCPNRTHTDGAEGGERVWRWNGGK